MSSDNRPDSGERETALQRELRRVGCFCGPVDEPDPAEHREDCAYRVAMERVDPDRPSSTEVGDDGRTLVEWMDDEPARPKRAFGDIDEDLKGSVSGTDTTDRPDPSTSGEGNDEEDSRDVARRTGASGDPSGPMGAGGGGDSGALVKADAAPTETKQEWRDSGSLANSLDAFADRLVRLKLAREDQSDIRSIREAARRLRITRTEEENETLKNNTAVMRRYNQKLRSVVREALECEKISTGWAKKARQALEKHEEDLVSEEIRERGNG